MKIGIIHPYFDVLGGAEITTLSLIEGLKKTSHQLTLYTIEPAKIVETNNFKIHKIKKNNFSSFWRYQRLKEVQKLFKASLNEELLVIMSGGLTLKDTNMKNVLLYCNSTFSGEESLLQNKDHDVRGLYLKVLQKNIQKSIKYLQSSRVKLISNSIFTKSEIKKRFQKDSMVIYPPVRISKFVKLSNIKKTKKVITISRFSPEKNLDFAVDVMKMSGFDYELIGNAKHGKQMKDFNKLKKSSGNKIKLFCNIQEAKIGELLSSAKVYLHASQETFGISVVEAIAAGCIPIVPDNSAHKETVPFTELRYMNKQDCLNKIKNALDAKYDNLLPKLKDHVTKFSEEKFQKNMLEIIHNLQN